MRERGLAICPLFNAPFFRSHLCRLDWLHVVDLGVCCDWLGELLVHLMAFQAGNSREAQLSCLWARIQELYHTYPPKAKLDNLTVNMLALKRGTPKLRAYGEESKGLVPVMHHIARDFSSEGTMSTNPSCR